MKKRKIEPIYVAAVLLLMYLPILTVVVYSFNAGRYGNWDGFSLVWYEQLFANRQIGTTLLNSIKLALLSCGAAILIGTAGAVGLARSRFRSLGLWENMSIMPMMIPEIILGMAYLAFFSFAGLSFGMGTLLIAHTVFCVPYILVNVRSRLVGLDPALVEAARDLGASPTRAFFDITLPLITPAVFSGALLAFAMSMDDVVISFFVTGPTTNTLPLHINSMLKTGITPEVNALCTLMLGAIFLVLALFGLARTILRKRRA